MPHSPPRPIAQRGDRLRCGRAVKVATQEMGTDRAKHFDVDHMRCGRVDSLSAAPR